MSEETSREELVGGLLETIGWKPAQAIVPLAGGRNNKVFRVETADGEALFKCYFHHPDDPRDRLGQEFAFLHHLARSGGQFSARPLASNPVEHVGLMEFIRGERPQFEEVDAHHIDQATQFFFAANQGTDHPEAQRIAPASEACFTIADHLSRTQGRVDRLDHILVEDAVDTAAVEFVRGELIPLWDETRAAMLAFWPDATAREESLPQASRCLSPSDFGFHNSLRQEGGKLRFLDFEYAGWDDPAKLIIDFANQPDMILESSLSDRFRQAVIAADADPAALEKRVRALEPVYQIKWACICLNDFLGFGRTRHQFTEGQMTNHRARREFQLDRARMMFGRARRSIDRTSPA